MKKTEFEKAGDEHRSSLVEELWQFASENKKWWLIPIFVVFGMIGLLIVLSATGAAPFIYTLF